MNCYECALANETVAAVAVCRHCGVGLCLEHLRKAQAYRVGGTLYGCTHQLAEVGRINRFLTPDPIRGQTGSRSVGELMTGAPRR